MKSNIYVIYDRVAEESGPIYEAKNDGVALRKYQATIVQNNMIPGDFKLLKLASIDHETNIVSVFAEILEVDASVEMDVKS